MRVEGTTTIKAPREKVWAFLTDPEAVASCAPGLQSLEVEVPQEKFRTVCAVGFGAVKARFTTDVEWTELDPPNRGSMRFHGATPGSVIDGTTSMVLSEAASGETHLAWTADIQIAGALVTLASRLMDSVARKVTRQFFAAAQKKIEKRKRTPRRH